MKMKKINRVLISILMLTLLIGINTQINAYSASTSSISLNVGESKTITISASNEVVQISASSGNSGIATVSGGTTDGILDSEIDGTKTTTYTIKGISAGNTTVSFVPEDYQSYGSASASTLTVAVEVKEASSSGGSSETGGSSSSETPKTTPTPTPAPNFTKADKTMYTTKDDINLRSDYTTTSGAIKVSKGTELNVIGTSTDKYNGYVWYKVSYKGQTRYIAKDFLTETKPEDNEEKDESKANLKKIEITGVELDPKFSSDVTEYSAKIVNYKEKEIHIIAEAENENAKVTIEGDKDIKVGENTIKITVTADDDITKTYTIKLTNEESDAFGLSSLVIKNVDLKGFKPDVYEYKIDFQDLDKLEIEAKATEEGATVEIIGNENLKKGENIITIIVTSKDGETIVTYQIKANKTVTVKNIIKGFSKKQIAISAAIAVVALIIIIVLIVRYVKHKNDNDDDYYTNDNDDDYDVNDYKVSDYTSLDNFEEKIDKKESSSEEVEDFEDEEVEDIKPGEFKKDTEYNVWNDKDKEKETEIETKQEGNVEDIVKDESPRKYSVDDLFKGYEDSDFDDDDTPSRRRGRGKHSR